MRTQAISDNQTADEILRGIEQDEFLCIYQPQFCARTLQITGIEALVRWQTKSCGLLRPEDFLGLAEDIGVLNQIDQIVLRKSTADFRDWIQSGWIVPRLSVNVSDARLRDPDLVRELSSLSIFAGKTISGAG